MVPIVENRIPDGLVLSCDNRAYKEAVLKNAQTAARLGLRVIGRSDSGCKGFRRGGAATATMA
jgi:hypothetical protein